MKQLIAFLAVGVVMLFFAVPVGAVWQSPVQLTDSVHDDEDVSINAYGTKIAFRRGDGDDSEIYFVEDLPASAHIPTLSEWGMIIMAFLLAAVALRGVRRKQGRLSV